MEIRRPYSFLQLHHLDRMVSKATTLCADRDGGGMTALTALADLLVRTGDIAPAQERMRVSAVTRLFDEQCLPHEQYRRYHKTAYESVLNHRTDTICDSW